MNNSLFLSDFKIPNPSVTVVGTAISARDQWSRIPHNSYKIACNSAITIPFIDWDMWICLDDTIPDKPYFAEYLEKFKGVKVYRRQGKEPMEIVADTLRNLKLDIEHFMPGRPKNKYPTEGDNLYLAKVYWENPERQDYIVKGELTKGGTVAGFALQIAWYYGITQAFIHGVHMKGSLYSTEGKNPHHAEDELWHERLALQRQIDHMQQNGMNITALTETVLENI